MPSPGPSGTWMCRHRTERLREQMVAQRILADIVLDHARVRQMVGVRIVGQRRHEVQRGGKPDRAAPDGAATGSTPCSRQSTAIAGLRRGRRTA